MTATKDDGRIEGPTGWGGDTAGNLLIQAVAYQPTSEPRMVKLVVIHTAETPERSRVAIDVARWFAGELGPAPKASAHYVVDDGQVIQCVLERDVAYHAPGANRRSIGVEHAGCANQTAEQWADAYSQAVLARSAQLVAGICRRWSIPPIKLGPVEILRGDAGICGHADVTLAYPEQGTHQDPGHAFPWPRYLAAVAAL